ncbi:hypothetical protein Tco_1483485 [Tanacetum coccineum]
MGKKIRLMPCRELMERNRKSVAFPLVKNYVTNIWSKYGFQKIIRDEDDFFYIKFDSITSVEHVLEQGPWMIRNTPFILNKWTPNLSLCKDKGRIGFARALIEVSAAKDLKKEVIMAMPNEDGEGHTNVQIQAVVTNNEKTDGFTTVTNRKKNKGKKQVNPSMNKTGGFKMNVPKNFEYMPVSVTKPILGDGESSNAIKSKNPFDVFSEQENLVQQVEEENGSTQVVHVNANDDSDNEEAERSLQGKGPKDEVVGNSSGTAHVKDPLGHEGITVEIESAPERRSQEAERSLQGKGPKDEVVGNSSGTAHVKDPLGHEGMTVEIESALEGRSQVRRQCEQRKVLGRILWKTIILVNLVHNFDPGNHEYTCPKDWTSNANLCSKGRRIILGWNTDMVTCHQNIGLPFWSFLDRNPMDTNLHEEEAAYLIAFIEAKVDEEHFLKQKAKIEWLEQFLGTNMPCDAINHEGLFLNQISHDTNLTMVRGITNEEIKSSMFDIGDDHAHALMDSPLIPKISTPLKVNDYRPISCCNVLYRCISKILTKRIMDGLKEVVSDNQSAFILGRRISDNILITQELMHNYHRNRGPPRCAFKVDIQKAYGTVDWNFLRNILKYDLFIFMRGDVDSAKLTREALDEGLFLVKYLGVPLISSRLLNRDCKILVDKVSNRIRDWKNKSLSYAGRLQFCKFVLSSMHVYWAAVLVIPIGIILDIQQLMRGFLWCNGELKQGKAKVAWDTICLPKQEGGVGIRSLEIFNITLMITYIWNLVTNRESLWVRWVHTYKLKGRTIWDIPVKAEMSWGWRKLLQIRELVKPFFWKKLGNGMSTSLWFDRRNSQCPLTQYITPRDINREGFNMRSCVADVVSNEGWL